MTEFYALICMFCANLQAVRFGASCLKVWCEFSCKVEQIVLGMISLGQVIRYLILSILANALEMQMCVPSPNLFGLA